jgi:uncharacterized protein YjbI with pentapeptide repeats
MTGAISFTGDYQRRIVDDELDGNGTNLTGVNLTGANLRGAIMNDGSVHD